MNLNALRKAVALAEELHELCDSSCGHMAMDLVLTTRTKLAKAETEALRAWTVQANSRQELTTTLTPKRNA